MTPQTVAYHLCDLKTGTILEDLPLTAEQPIRNILAREDTGTFTLPVHDPACPPNWQEALAPGPAMIVQTLDNQPVQGWAVLDTTTGGATVPISVATLEHCLAESNVPDVYDYLDEAQIIAQLCGEMGTRFGFTVRALMTGRMADVSYSVDEDRDVLSAISERMATSGGAEWRIVLAWHDDTHRAFDKIIQIADQVGIVRPDAIFDLDARGGGNIDTYTRKTALGPTMMIGASEGSGSSRIVDDPIYADDLLAAGWPIWEKRKTYTGLGDSLDEDAALSEKTAAELAATKTGIVTWTVTGTNDAPRPGGDFDPGDTVRIEIAPRPPRDPAGGTADVRVLGYELEPGSGQVTPIFWEDTDG